MKHILLSILLALIALPLSAQSAPEACPQRTPEEVAQKQTGMLVRRLHLTDSIQRDTLYRMHLKYARQRQISNTVREARDRRMAMDEELKGILTAEQYEAFLNLQINPEPRHPQPKVGRMPQERRMPPPPPQNPQ